MFSFWKSILGKVPDDRNSQRRKTVLFEHLKQRHDFYELVLREERRRMFERFRRESLFRQLRELHDSRVNNILDAHGVTKK